MTSEDCLTCHSDPGLTRREGSRTVSLRVDAAALHASAHAKLECSQCHGGISEIPHPSRLPAARCETCHADVMKAVARSAHAGAGDGAGSCVGCHGGAHEVRAAGKSPLALCERCHDQEVAEYRGSVHGVALANGDADASTCRDCHGAFHSVRRHTDPDSPVNRSRLARTCARCHADRELMTRRKITIPEAYTLYVQSVHGRSTQPGAATCSDCHESHRLRRATDPSSSIYRTNIPATCGRCHGAETAAYRAGIHGVAMRRGVVQAPVCTDCHGEHRIRGPRDPDSPVVASAVTTTCSRCHEATGIRETFGLPAGRLNTYRDSFHGLAARGGSPAVANCASCHGYHEILPSSDSRSAIAPGNLAKTCGKCHPGAGTRFAMGPVHVAMATSDNRILYWVRITYLWLIFGTIGGMALHQGLDFVHKLRVQFRRQQEGAPSAPAPTRWFLRMTGFERAQHLLLLTSFFTLVYTGFALKFPESWPFAWLARLEHGYAWRSLIHRIAAAVMVAAALIHVAYLLTRRGREQLVALFPRLRDAREAAGNLLYLTGRRAHPPDFDRFGYIEKAEYWALIWGTAVMTLTGLLLWFENWSLRHFDKWVLDLATLVHYYEAWLAFLAIVVWHLYQNVVNPDVYPMNWTWLTGRISEEHLRHEHGGEWRKLATAEPDAAIGAVGPVTTAPESATPPARRPKGAAGPEEPPPRPHPA